MQLKKYLTIFGTFNILSKILGFIRDMLIAYRLGTSVFSDIFFIAFRLPNLFRSIFADGAFSSVFLPIYSEIWIQDGKDSALKFAYKMQSLLIASLIVLIFIIEFFMGGTLKLFAPGLFATEYEGLLILTARIIFPYIILISIISLHCTILQSAKKFGVMSSSSIILNILLIIFLCIKTDGSEKTIILLSISVILSGLFTIVYLFIVLKLNDLVPKIVKFSIDEPVRKFLKRIVMAGVSSEIYHVNILIDTFFASTIAYGVSYLYYAERILYLPLALIGTALSIIILPFISEAITNKDLDRAIKIQNKALSLGLIFGVPASAALILIPNQIIDGLFVLAGGKFDLYSAQQTAKALQAYAFGLMAYMLNKVFLTVFFALGDTKTPAKFALISLIINTILNFVLIQKYQHVGIAFASAFSAWVNFAFIIITLRKKGLYKLCDEVKSVLTNVFFSTAIMIFVIELIVAFSDSYLNISGSHILKTALPFFISAAGLSTYFLIFFIIKLLSSKFALNRKQ
jgi:putative peptidoglycan lipid II flippase